MNISLNRLGKYCNGMVHGEAMVTGVKVDSREVKPGDMYVALKGAKVDGHNFIDQAISKGASSILVDRNISQDIPYIMVDDTLQSFYDMAINYKNSLDMFVIGVTGSNGKTSVKDMLQSILSLDKDTVSTYSNQNTIIGCCLNIFRCNQNTRYLVLEMGLDAPLEVNEMAELIKPDASIVVSVEATHMTYFNDINDVAKEKLKIFNHTKNKALCFYQGDYESLRNNTKFGITFGFNKDNDYIVSDVLVENTKTTFKVNNKEYTTNLLGEHQASNASGVIALCKAIGISEESINTGLNQVSLTKMRTEILNVDKAIVIMDAYKSNPKSALYALDLLSHYQFEGRRYAFIGDMKELGPTELQQHLDLLQYALSLKLDGIYTFGSILNQVYELSFIESDMIKHYNNIENLKERFDELSKSENLILIKGSRSLEMERLLKR